ncbi:hypothetical protein QCE47_08005 [Caballeronia sp. LZ025]|jgi:hypothetical protein|uniref:hypothetical protein n=1 Tax=Caballeronia TaxID=1827195 RepID=UPI001FCFF6D2|nr:MULTISPECIES: hypothetical protein [Caballeronia]MDR5732287.1 hypothetical protein [Caballeronia sp. LZ025]
MSFPEWGRSYNALWVPLTSDWQCSLVPARDVQDVDRGWKLSYEERQKARKECEEQIEQDQRDFDRLFRLSIDRCAARACRDFGEYAAFIRAHLSISGLSPPVDGDDITCILRDAVRDGQLIPAIDRAWRGSRRVARQYAPQSWPKRTPDPKPTVYGFCNGQYSPLDANGFFIDDTPYVSSRVAAKAAATASAVGGSGGSGSGFDWLGAVERVAGAMLGGAGSSGDSGGNSMLKSFGDTDDGEGSSLLSDAQPFEYQPDEIGDEEQTAWLPSTGGPPNSWLENDSGKKQWRYYDKNGNAAVDIDFGHDHGFGAPHSHNWDNGGRDNGNPVSIF